MKKFLLILSMILLSAVLAAAQSNWEVVQEGDMEIIPNACSFLNESIGVYVGDDGGVVLTTDGAISGEAVREPDGSGLDWENVEFFNDSIIVACGTRGIIYKSTDSGYNWSQIGDTINYRSMLNYIDMVTLDVIWAAGDDSTLLKSENGGETWTQIEYGFDQEDLDGGLTFLNPDSGVIAIDNSKAPKTWYTHNGGETWTMVELPFPEVPGISFRVYDAASDNKSSIAIAGFHYCLFISIDAGVTYNRIGPYTPENKQFRQVRFADENTVVAGGSDGHLIKTAPDGTEWTDIDIPSGQTAGAFDFVNARTGFVFAGSGQWFRTTDGAATWENIREWPDVYFKSLAVVSPWKVVVGGWRGEITISEDGYYFTYPDNRLTGTAACLYAADFYDLNNGLIGGTNGELWRTADGGKTWTEIDTINGNNPMKVAGKSIYGVSYITDNIVLAGGRSGNVMKSEDGGLTWQSVEVVGFGTSSVYEFGVISDTQVLAAGSSGKIMTSSAGLDTFTLAKDYGAMTMRGIAVKGENIIVTSTYSSGLGGIYHTTVAKWDTLVEVFSDPDGDNLYSAAFANDSMACVVGEYGKIYVSADSGKTWQADNMPVELTLDRVRYDGNSYWAVGSKGVILRKFMAAVEPLSGLYINEFMADNESTIADPWGVYSDWIEIYNSNEYAVNMGDAYFTDDLSNLTSHRIPEYSPDSTIIPAKGYLLLWADGAPEKGVLHLGFRLNKDGEEIGMTGRDGFTCLDSVKFDAQIADTSYGRVTDGAETWDFFHPSSPNDNNENGTIVSISYIEGPVAMNYELAQNYPNPFNPTTSIEFSIIKNSEVLLEVYNITGQKVATLVNQKIKAGKVKITWNASGLASGVYFYKLTAGNFKAVKKMMLLK